MKFFSFLAAASLAGTSVLAHPVQQNEGSILETRQTQNVLLSPTGSVKPRLEIRQLKDTKPNQYTLLVLAMRQWMTVKFSDPTGYAAIAGIHGVPRVDYNNDGQCSSCAGTDGYCPHDCVHFPGWHRAYVALFEQEFLKVAKTIAANYPDSQRATMVAAANELRWPYYDWAASPPAGRPAFPKIMTDVTVTVNGPSGKTTFTNPLFRYDFSTDVRNVMVYTPFTTWTRTYRYPNNNGANAASNTQSAINAIANARASLQDQVYQLFTNCKSYLHFSNDDAGSSNAGCSNSLEGIHNTIHTIIGGPGTSSASGGHMTYLSTAAFDPAFWLHHCNVDRIFAMWQGINPTVYGATQSAPHSTWTIAQGETLTSDSPLKPFKRTSSTWWTTNTVRNWSDALKYTYPEFANSDGSPSAIRNYVNKLYGPNANAVAGSSKREADAMPQVASLIGDLLPGSTTQASNGSEYLYVANVNTPRYALNGTYTVLVFNGKPTSEDPSTWDTDPKLIGPMGVMSQPNMMDHDTIAAGSIPLTRALKETLNLGDGVLGSLAEAVVAPYLTKHLEWRIVQDGKSIDTSTVDGFVVSVVTSSAQVPSDANQFPVFSEFIPLLGVTEGQAGGANSTQQAASY